MMWRRWPDSPTPTGRFVARTCAVSAGAPDLWAVRAIVRMLELQGAPVEYLMDLGVNDIAGKTMLVRELLDVCHVWIAVAGMEGTLPEVVSSLSSRPVIGVPLSTGYGMHKAGATGIRAMSTYPVPGIVVTNTDDVYTAVMIALSLADACYNCNDEWDPCRAGAVRNANGRFELSAVAHQSPSSTIAALSVQAPALGRSWAPALWLVLALTGGAGLIFAAVLSRARLIGGAAQLKPTAARLLG